MKIIIKCEINKYKYIRRKRYDNRRSRKYKKIKIIINN